MSIDALPSLHATSLRQACRRLPQMSTAVCFAFQTSVLWQLACSEVRSLALLQCDCIGDLKRVCWSLLGIAPCAGL